MFSHKYFIWTLEDSEINWYFVSKNVQQNIFKLVWDGKNWFCDCEIVIILLSPTIRQEGHHTSRN